MAYVPLKPFEPVTFTVLVSGVSAGCCAAEAVPAAPSDTAQTIKTASAAVRIRFMGPPLGVRSVDVRLTPAQPTRKSETWCFDAPSCCYGAVSCPQAPGTRQQRGT